MKRASEIGEKPSAGSQFVPWTRMFSEFTGSFTAPVAGLYKVIAKGPGGRGNGSGGTAYGGGGGAHSEKTMPLSAGQAVTISVAHTGNTTVGAPYNMTAGKGQDAGGGRGTGGTASGGTLNYNGGDGGDSATAASVGQGPQPGTVSYPSLAYPAGGSGAGTVEFPGGNSGTGQNVGRDEIHLGRFPGGGGAPSPVNGVQYGSGGAGCILVTRVA